MLLKTCALCTLIMLGASCGASDAAPTDPGASGFSQTVSQYGAWNGALADTSSSPVPLAQTAFSAANGDNWVCQNAQLELKKNFSGFLAPGGTAGVLWPGALIQGATLIAGTPSAIPLPRSSITVSVDLGIADPSRAIDRPTSASVQDAVASLQREADSRLGPIDVVPAQIDFQMTEVHASNQFEMSLGVYAKGSAPAALVGIEVPGTVSFGVEVSGGVSQSFERHTIAVKLLQPMYTVSFADEAMSSPADYLASSVSDGMVQDLERRGIISSTNLPTYVKSVTYGRMLIYTMTNTTSATTAELQSATQAALDLFKVGNASAGSKLSVRDSLLLQNSEVQIVAFGGSQDSALAAIRTGQLGKFFTAVPSTQAVPLGYRLNYLKDGSVAVLGLGTSYTQSTCTAVPGTHSVYWHVRLTNVTSNGGCDSAQHERTATLVYHRLVNGSTSIGYPPEDSVVFPLLGDTMPGFRDTTVDREVVLLWPPPNDTITLGGLVGQKRYLSAHLEVRSVFRPLGVVPCSTGDDVCIRSRTFDADSELAVNPYEFQHIITLPGAASGCTVTFDYQVFTEPALSPPLPQTVVGGS